MRIHDQKSIMLWNKRWKKNFCDYPPPNGTMARSTGLTSSWVEQAHSIVP
jgi:hypothetical protein